MTQEEFLEILPEYMDSLTNHERAAVAYLFGLEGQSEHTPAETAEHFDVTEHRIKLILHKVIRRRSWQQRRAEIIRKFYE